VPVEQRVSVHGRLRPVSDATVRRVVGAVLEGERADADVSITFLGRDAMRRLNAEYKGHDRPTDVIAFPLTTPGGGVVGDVYICPWVARREAADRKVAPRQELIRLIVHGTLHVLGWEHPEDDTRTRSPMWRRQERYVERLA
jgi:probable rRNA maturation factor